MYMYALTLPLDDNQAYLETEEQCVRRLSERAASEEAELSGITCEMAQYDGLYMPSLVSNKVTADAAHVYG